MGFDFSTGDDVRGATIRQGLRGYAKDDVDQFREAAAALVDDLRRRVDVASGHLAQLGLEEPLDLRQEFATVGKEVAAILEAARTAATDIRQRATADGERWRSEAETDAARMRSEAWEEASTHLETSVAQAAETRSTADEDALFIRAQAEKEAIRLTSEAKRDAEELVRSARAEADAIISTARESADAAQERTRALEVRREELMVELEEARRAIGGVEAEIEEQHNKLVASETSTVRIIDQGTSDNDAPTEDEWFDEDGTVRLVSGGPPPGRAEPMEHLEPVVDADDIVAEVESLQVAPDVDDPWSDRWASGKTAGVVTPAAEPAPLESVSGPLPEPDPVAVPDTEVDEDVKGADVVETTDEPVPDPIPAATPVLEEEPADERGDGLSDLFASLRAPVEAAAPPTTDAPQAEEPAGTPDPEVVAPALADTPDESAIDDEQLDEEEAVLLPITNRALRAVKKQILEFQNVMLEATKADPDGWRPDIEEYRLALDPHVHSLLDESHRAAGGEGASDVPVDFGNSLGEAVASAAETMEGSGYRETSASLGRVFRSWRSDEAERRLTDLATSAYRGVTSTRM